MAFPGIDGEEGDVLDIHRTRTAAAVVVAEEEAQVGMADGAARSQDDGVFLPVLRGHVDVGGDEVLTLFHRALIDELYPQFLGTAVGHTGIDGEAVVGIFLNANAEVALVLQSCPHVAVACREQTCIVGVAVEGAVVLDFDFAKGHPSHEGVGGELEGAVLDEFAIESSVGGIVDVLEEDAIHGLLNGRTEFLGVDVEDVCLRCGRRGCQHEGSEGCCDSEHKRFLFKPSSTGNYTNLIKILQII